MKRELFAAVALLSSGALPAATIGGRLSYPGEALPAMIVVARNAAGATLSTETKAGQARYRLEVPAGSYLVFAIPKGVATQPGRIPLRGAHTGYSVCGRDKAKMQAGRCQSGPLVEIRLAAADQRNDVDIDDWTLPDTQMATLNLALSDATPVKSSDAPFASYPADTSPLPSIRSPDFASAPARARAGRGSIERAATRGPYNAGRVAVARWACGRNCEHWALVDMASGRVVMEQDKALQPLRRNFPCDADPLEFREDSHLLRVHRLDGDRVVTQDFLWSIDAQRLEKSAESAMSAEQFCRR
jgi:hypothetical protein